MILKFLKYIVWLSIIIFSTEIYAEKIDWSVSGNSLNVKINDIYANCCSKYEQDITITKDEIIIIQRDTTSEKCRCMCYFEINHIIDQLSAGQYKLKVYREELFKYGYPENNNYLIAEEIVEISFEESASPASFSMIQSECKNRKKIQENESLPKNVQIYPNPASSNVTLRFFIQNKTDISITLFNLLGKEILTINKKNLEEGTHTLNINAGNLPNGMYLGKLTTSDGKVSSFKIIWSR